MAYCKQCGTFMQENARFCEACGAPAADETAVQPANIQRAEQTAVRNTPEQESLAKGALIWSIVGAALGAWGLPGIIVSAIAMGKVKQAHSSGAVGGKLKAASIVSKVGLGLSIAMTLYYLLLLVISGVMIAGRAYSNLY